MKNLRVQPESSIINVGGLVLIYILLCILTILFAQTFFSDILQNGKVPGLLNLVIFFTIPAVLLVFLAISVLNLVRDLIARRTGSKFQARLLAYFIIVVIFAAAPVTIITSHAAVEVMRFLKPINMGAVLHAAENFALDSYAFHTEKLAALVRDPQLNLSPNLSAVEELPREIAGIQDFFLQEDETWESRAFRGDAGRLLRSPPSLTNGFVSREMPRDRDTIRYVVLPEPGIIRVLSYDLGEGFDETREILENETVRFEILDSLKINLLPLLIIYYGIFFFPTLLMTVIIAISFTRRVTRPIVDLTEATHRVAAGDFSIQLLVRQGDELGRLIGSFNAMVQNLEKSQTALVKAEKISLWQSMAQQLAHEIKNPLTPIKLSAERVLRRWRNEPERIGSILEESMFAIIQETENLSTLLTEFRTLSRPMEPSHTWTNVRNLAEEIIIPYRTSYPQINFNLSYMGEDIRVKVDKYRLSQVLTNLIINGIDAMNGAGSIEIRTDLVKKRESRYCRLGVKDTGKGISKEDSSQIFTPYYTTKESGTGLGLPIVERIVNDHGGTIWFNSAEGIGTTFFIDLPVEETPDGEAESPRGESPAL
ncbi:MAG: HAMP domain-containing protein [Treponema sp.]|nr:HAMP domain-containing protein [Treponema sp.]